jgi:hypothetical protein
VRHVSEQSANFEDAVAKFQEFLRTSLYSGEIVWVEPDDVLLTGKRLVYVRVASQTLREKTVRKTYDEGMPQRRGVLFRTICDLGGKTCSHVWAPRSNDEAEGLLMPVGLKLSVQTDKIRGVSVKSAIWWAYLRIRYGRKQVLREWLFR